MLASGKELSDFDVGANRSPPTPALTATPILTDLVSK